MIGFMLGPTGPSIFSGGRAVAPNDRRTLSYAVVAAVIVAGLTLSACGRKGALEPPPHAQATDPAYADQNPVEAKKNAKPDRPFILDRLL